MPSLGPFPDGMNNTADTSRLPVDVTGNPSAVACAVNMTCDSSGCFHTAPSAEKVYSGVGIRDGWSCPLGCFFRQGTTVMRFDGQSAEVICQNIRGSKITWCYFNGTVYFSDGIVSKKIKGGAVTNWGISSPASAPVISGTNRKNVEIMACYTYVAADGSESGSSPAAVSVSGNVVSRLDDSPDAQAVAKRVYATEPGGSTFYHAATVPRGVNQIDIGADYGGNGTLSTMNKMPPPPGNIIRYYSGRIYVVSGNYIYYTDSFSMDLVSRGTEHVGGESRLNFFGTAERIKIFEPVEGGIWVVADKTYFISGKNPETAEFVERSHLSGVEGTSSIDDGGNARWMTPDGYAVGGPDGGFAISTKGVAPDIAETGAAGNIELPNGNYDIVVLNEPKTNPKARRGFSYEYH